MFPQPLFLWEGGGERNKVQNVFLQNLCKWLHGLVVRGPDSSSEILMQPVPTEEEIQFILDAISEYLTVDVRRSDVMSAWSGIRPLAMDPNSKDTASASRDHVITQDPDGLITVTGIQLNCCKQS